MMEMVDTHIHLWDLEGPLTYAFLRETDPAEEAMLGNYDAIKKSYLIDDYLEDIRGCAVAKAVHVQAALGHPRPAEETAWLQQIADRHGYPQGIIGHCNLCAPEADAVMEAHCRYPNFRGIRMLGTQGILTSEAFQRGFALLAERNLVYDLESTVADMPAAFDLANRFPNTTIVLEHTGLPLERSPEYFRTWSEGMRMLARADNVVCKISGLGMTDHQWTEASLRPYVETAIEAFGPRRSMFGSNWSVDSLYSTYSAIVEAYREIISKFSEDERHQVLHGTAESVYRI